MRIPGILVLILMCLLPEIALGGPNAGGTLIVHNTGLTYGGPADTTNWCIRGDALTNCQLANAEVDDSSNTYRVWKVYAAFDSASAPRLKALDFGVQYTPWTGSQGSLVLVGHGPCTGDPNNGAFELPGAGWPNTGTGTAIVFQNAQTTSLVECYFHEKAFSCQGRLGGHFQDGPDVPAALPFALC